jgi:hypothetical protein
MNRERSTLEQKGDAQFYFCTVPRITMLFLASFLLAVMVLL